MPFSHNKWCWCNTLRVFFFSKMTMPDRISTSLLGTASLEKKSYRNSWCWKCEINRFTLHTKKNIFRVMRELGTQIYISMNYFAGSSDFGRLLDLTWDSMFSLRSSSGYQRIKPWERFLLGPSMFNSEQWVKKERKRWHNWENRSNI